jgi:hypothetical protein
MGGHDPVLGHPPDDVIEVSRTWFQIPGAIDENLVTIGVLQLRP